MTKEERVMGGGEAKATRASNCEVPSATGEVEPSADWGSEWKIGWHVACDAASSSRYTQHVVKAKERPKTRVVTASLVAVAVKILRRYQLYKRPRKILKPICFFAPSFEETVDAGGDMERHTSKGRSKAYCAAWSAAAHKKRKRSGPHTPKEVTTKF